MDSESLVAPAVGVEAGVETASSTVNMAAPVDSVKALPFENMKRLGRVRRHRRFALSLSVMALDVTSLMLGLSVGNFISYGLGDLPQLVKLASASVPLLLLMMLGIHGYQARLLSNASASIQTAIRGMCLLAASLFFLAFLLKAGQDFSRVQFFAGMCFAGGLMVAFRGVLAVELSRMPQSYLFADLHIFDGLCPRDRTLLAIDASDAGVSPNRGDFGAVRRLGELVEGADRVIVHCDSNARPGWADVLKTLSVPSEIIVPELDRLYPLEICRRDATTSVLLSHGGLSWDQQLLKRGLDLTLSILALPLLLPIFAVVAVAIKLDSRGPVFFRQPRIGLGNRTFQIWKFRSMRTSMQDVKASKLTERNDPRVTRVGSFIRKTSIDELPQIFNVIMGQMSLVGPRPHAAAARAGSLLYWEVDQTYWERHVVKPGITGLAQVRGFRGNTFVEENLRDRLTADLEYVSRWSIFLDIKILVLTLAVPMGRNAF